MLTCIALALAIQQKTFDFDHKGAPVVRVVEAMAEAFGEEMKADGTMLRDYVIVAFRGTTAKRARELLADALNASWVEDDGELILHRSRAQELEDERTDLAVNTRFVRGIQDQISKFPGSLTGADNNCLLGAFKVLLPLRNFPEIAEYRAAYLHKSSL